MLPKISFDSLADAKSKLKKNGVDTEAAEKERAARLLANFEKEKTLDATVKETREYFFHAQVDAWYSKMEAYTFRSEFTPIVADEAKAIIKYWNEIGQKIPLFEEQEGEDAEKSGAASATDPYAHIPPALYGLAARFDAILKEKFPSSEGVFIKLSTRSPKDSKTIFRRAVKAFNAKLDAHGNVVKQAPDSSLSSSGADAAAAADVMPTGLPEPSRENERLVLFSDEMVKAATVKSGMEAMCILLDSWRVAEDLMYAFEEKGEEDKPVSLVIRAWDSRVTPQCEYRGFVWDGKLNCVGQYWHSLYFPQLVAIKDQVAKDLLEFFEANVRDSLPVPTAMLDFMWFGPGQVLLTEVNPLMEGLGSFKGSTGLFDYYDDADVLTGKKPFEMRIRLEEEPRAQLISHMSMDWRRVVFGY